MGVYPDLQAIHYEVIARAGGPPNLSPRQSDAENPAQKAASGKNRTQFRFTTVYPEGYFSRPQWWWVTQASIMSTVSASIRNWTSAMRRYSARRALAYNVVLPAALAFFHLALAAAASLARTAGLRLRSSFWTGLGASGFVFLVLAHLALAAPAILARAAADIWRFLEASTGAGIGDSSLPTPLPSTIESI